MVGIFIDHSEFVEGGLLNNVDVEVVESRFDTYDYGKGEAHNRTVLRWGMRKLDDTDGTLHQQYFSVGGEGNFAPSEDGTKLLSLGGRTNINVNSNFAMLMASCEKAGVQKKHYAADISSFEGMQCHVSRIPDARNIPRGDMDVEDDGKPDRPKEVLVITNIIKAPWDNKGGKKAVTKTKTKAKAKAAPEEEEEEEVDDALDALLATLIIKHVAKAKSGSIDGEGLSVQVYQDPKVRTLDKAVRMEVMGRCQDLEYLAKVEGITVDEDGIVSIAD